MSNGLCFMSYHPDHVSCISLLHCLVSAPSLPIHYRCLNATTSRSAPVPGFDTQYLDGAATLIFSLSIPVTGSRDSHIEPGEDSSRPLCRTPRRRQSGLPRRSIPLLLTGKGFDVGFTLSRHFTGRFTVRSSFFSTPDGFSRLF